MNELFDLTNRDVRRKINGLSLFEREILLHNLYANRALDSADRLRCSALADLKRLVLTITREEAYFLMDYWYVNGTDTGEKDRGDYFQRIIARLAPYCDSQMDMF